MFTKNNLLTTVCAVTLVTGSPVFSEAQSTQILEEYFDIFKSTPIEIEVGDKEDNARSSQWNNVTLKSSDGEMQLAVPWIKVSKKLLGGFELTIAEQIDGAFQSPDPEVLEPVRFVVESKNMAVDINGKEGAREYGTKFDEMAFRTLDNNIINITAKLMDGTSTKLVESGDTGKTSGSFNIKSMVINYGIEIEGEKAMSASKMTDFTGKFEVPFYKAYDPENPIGSFDPSRDLFVEYNIGSGTTDISMGSAVGPIEAKATFGTGTGAFGITGSVASISGETKDIAYDINATGMGLPPMQISASSAIVKLFMPLDNVDESKPAGYKIAFSGLNLSDQVWAMFDPTAILPRDEINLDIDLLASLRWVKKISEIDVKNTDQEPPFVVDSAEIKALNLTIAGAEMQTTGSVLVDNSQFPPVPEGTVNISLKGAQGLIGKLTEIGLIPTQNAMMIQGMTAMFFQPGDGGKDHLTSVIEMTKDGHIIANGMPIK
jgi:hypothetical protein